MSATLDSIDAAIISQLGTLASPTPGSLKLVDRYAPDPRAKIGEQVLGLVGNKLPAALVYLETDEAKQSVELLSGADPETVSTGTWSVLACAADTRPVKGALKGSVGTAGVYALASSIRSALNGLVIDGLWRSTRLRYVGLRWLVADLGRMYVLSLKFQALTAIDQTPAPDASAPYTGTTFHLHLADDGVVPPERDPIITGKDS